MVWFNRNNFRRFVPVRSTVSSRAAAFKPWYRKQTGARKIQRAYRGYQRRLTSTGYRLAATGIQKAYRGYKGRKYASALKKFILD